MIKQACGTRSSIANDMQRVVFGRPNVIMPENFPEPCIDIPCAYPSRGGIVHEVALDGGLRVRTIRIDAPDIGWETMVQQNECVFSNRLVNVGGLEGVHPPDGVLLVTSIAQGFDQSMDHFIKLRANDGCISA